MERVLFITLILVSINLKSMDISSEKIENIRNEILNDRLMYKVDSMAHEVISTGLNAGDGYGEVWIRDFNTFIELAMDVMPDMKIQECLNTFFYFQGSNGDIVDGYIDAKKAIVNYNYRYSNLCNNLVAHKNTVETDQETSLIQAIYQYVKKSNNSEYLHYIIDGVTVEERIDFALQYLLNEKLDKKYGLIVGATTADWGDVQPEHIWGVEIDENTHFSIDIYDNAMLVIAIDNFIEITTNNKYKIKWTQFNKKLKNNIRKHLWDSCKGKFIPHIYIGDSPFPKDFDEKQIYYHGGTAVAILAGLLSEDEVKYSNNYMLDNVRKSGAQSIGLTLYPPYPAGFFKNKNMKPYSYQNGGDWTWFGARMICGLIDNGLICEAYYELKPMLERVVENKGFYEWYTIQGEPKGSGTFRGEAGVLYKAIKKIRNWAKAYNNALVE